MTKYVMDRDAFDNKYLHRDFHMTAELGIKYVGENYGDEAVIDYLTDYAKSFYKPHIEEIKKDGLIAFKKYLEKIYTAEESIDALEAKLDGDELTVKIKYCPAIKYMKSIGHEVNRWYIETVRTTYKVVANESGYKFNLLSYNEEDGACEFIVGGEL